MYTLTGLYADQTAYHETFDTKAELRDAVFEIVEAWPEYEKLGASATNTTACLTVEPNSLRIGTEGN